KQAGQGSTVETLKLPSFEGPELPKLTAPGGYIADIPKGNLKAEIEKLAKQPEYAYLKQLQTAKNVDWKKVNLAYNKWDYKSEGMTPAAAAVVVIVVTVLTYGAMSGAAAGTAGATGAGAGGAAAGTAAGTGAAAGSAAAGSSAAAIGAAAGKAALASLASQAAVALINNKGNLENTLKELGKSSTVKQIATAAVTAGVLQGIGGFNTEVAKAVSEQFGNPVAGKLTANLINTTAAASVGTAINGGSLKDNLGNAALGALVTTAHGEIASKIKVNISEDYVAHKIAHAVAGCAAAAAANQGKCRDGAIGAAVGEMVGEAMLGGRDVNTLSAKERQKIIGYSQIIAGSTVALVKGDVNTAANAAAVAVESNALSNFEIVEIGKRVDKECNQGNNVECRNKIIAEAVNKSDQRSKLTKQDIADITAVQNKYAAEAFSICKGNSACATFVGNKFTYARLHCESSGCMANIAQSIIRETSSRYGSVWDTASRVFEDFSTVLPTIKAVPFNFKNNQLLTDHFRRHGSEFGAKTANDYLAIGRDVMRTGTRVKYQYRGELTTGYVKFIGNNQKGEAKFAFVGTNNQGVITTIHVKTGNDFWKTINGNPSEKIIYPR
ncbi:DUF637 domain-containing protein, partial [Neisseria dentiae]|uniref:DUF637 domain-containing protein n=1 Tax=Neisseria dentiae TaxID=194197 RepID=UPI0035A01F52